MRQIRLCPFSGNSVTGMITCFVVLRPGHLGSWDKAKQASGEIIDSVLSTGGNCPGVNGTGVGSAKRRSVNKAVQQAIRRAR